MEGGEGRVMGEGEVLVAELEMEPEVYLDVKKEGGTRHEKNRSLGVF